VTQLAAPKGCGIVAREKLFLRNDQSLPHYASFRGSLSMAAEGDIRGRSEAQWRALLANRRGAPLGSIGAGELEALYGPLCAVALGQSFIVAHLAQSLDGKIASMNGASRWISGEEDLCHTHRMRALADAVVVGADTVLHDDPLLTVRRCSGTHPVRVVIDPERKLEAHHKVFTDRSARTIVIAAADRRNGKAAPDVETIALPRTAADHGRAAAHRLGPAEHHLAADQRAGSRPAPADPPPVARCRHALRV